jgi:hypothetical protein
LADLGQIEPVEIAVMSGRRIAFAFLIASLFMATMRSAHPGALQPVALRDICVTNGEIRTGPDGRLQIDSPSSRAVLRFRSQPAVEIRFTYLRSSAKSKPLASGELRRQIGIKLRAENTCNLVYAMWHIEPDSRVAVSIKHNPGMSTHEQCHAGGYINLQQSGEAAPPKIVAGQTHTLRAELRGASLVVSADGVEAWHGDLGPVIASFDGPVGLRTDNARFAFDYFVGPAKPGSATPDCRQTAGD